MIDHELHATWRARLEEQQTSGLSAAAWCREQGIPDHQFYYWKKKFAPESKTPSAVEWTPVVLIGDKESDQAGDRGITIRVGSVSIAVQPGFDEALLIDVIKVIQAC